MLHDCANAVRLGMDWRPIFGLRAEDAGTLVERVATEVVLEAAVESHNKAMKG